ncbi:MAG: serine/threonine protein kinase, partial [Spirochaetia bacterium]
MSRTPESIGKYKIVSEIAKGGMGAVFKAIHPTLKRPVILKKLMLKSRKSLVERFKREARIMMDFRNENIVDVYDHFKEGTSYYIVLEYIDGVSLDQLIRQERYLQEDLALYIFMDACKALKYAHDKGVIHRDIKPANILISRNGEIKLVDFGIAVSVEDDEAGLTKEGMTLGTPSYMAPEQFENTKNVDKRADIYSMGVMLYEMVTGKKPFPGSLSAEAIAAIHKGKYVNPKKINPEITGKSLGIIKKSMRPKTQKRYQDLQPIIRKLQRSFSPSKEAEVKEHLTALVEGKAWIPTEKKPSPFRFLFPAILIAAVLSTGGFFAVQAGLHYEYLLPNS